MKTQVIMKTQTQHPNYEVATDANVNTNKMAKLLAHEIKNPLSRVFICVEQLKKTAEEHDESDFYINLIGESGKEIERILNDFIKATSVGELKLKRRNLAEFIKENLSFAFEKTEHQSIRVVENYSDATIEAEIDEEKITIALQHIIVNAIESIEGDDGSIEIEVSKKENNAVIRIIDNGCGMPGEALDNLFVPFYSTKPKRKGLGLPLAYRIISAHNGKIEVKSSVGAGTEITISLPLY